MNDSSSNDRSWRRGRRGWGAALLLAVAVAVTGLVAYNAGVRQGATEAALLAAQAPTAAPGAPAAPAPPLPPYGYYGYYGHRPWGFGGFGFFSPLLFLFFWFVVLRTLLWGGPWRRHWGYYGGGPMWRAEEWHRQAHERMGAPLPAGGPSPGGPERGDEHA